VRISGIFAHCHRLPDIFCMPGSWMPAQNLYSSKGAGDTNRWCVFCVAASRSLPRRSTRITGLISLYREDQQSGGAAWHQKTCVAPGLLFWKQMAWDAALVRLVERCKHYTLPQ
jgi:hypothetical protein